MAKTLGQQQAEYGITAQNPYGLSTSSQYYPTPQNNPLVSPLVNNREMRDDLQAKGSDFTNYQNELNKLLANRGSVESKRDDTRLQSLLDNPSSVTQTAGYKFALDQGNQAINRSAAAKGTLGSGNILAELAKYGQGMASQEYGNQVNLARGVANDSYGRYADQANSLASLMGGAQKFGVATDFFKQPTYGQPVQSSNTSWNMSYGQPVSNTYNW